MASETDSTVDGINKFGATLVRNVMNQDNPGNIFLSPFRYTTSGLFQLNFLNSICAALGMTAIGTAGDSQKEILQAMCLQSLPTTLSDLSSAFGNILGCVFWHCIPDIPVARSLKDVKGVILKSANAAMIVSGVKVNTEYKEALTTHFGYSLWHCLHSMT